jgi:hypothetical protein
VARDSGCARYVHAKFRLAGLLLWGALSWRYSAQLDNKDSIIAARNATIQAQDAFLAEYRSKLKGASPDEVVKKIANLESEVQSLQALERARSELDWPSLKEEQIAIWAARLLPYKQGFVAVFFEDASSAKFRDTLYEVFKRAGWLILLY